MIPTQYVETTGLTSQTCIFVVCSTLRAIISSNSFKGPELPAQIFAQIEVDWDCVRMIPPPQLSWTGLTEMSFMFSNNMLWFQRRTGLRDKD